MRTLVAVLVMAAGVLVLQPAPMVGHHAVRIPHVVTGLFDPSADLNTSRFGWL